MTRPRSGATGSAELTRGSIKANGFKRVALTFMGLNNQNQHDSLFRGFLYSWKAYTAARIKWIDLAEADCSPRLHRAIATHTIQFRPPGNGRTVRRGSVRQGPHLGGPRPGAEEVDYPDYVAHFAGARRH
ncbi:MAG: hypothetical protein ACREE5_10865 [Acetobacteraceae bacterium]